MEIKRWENGELFETNGGHMRWVFWPGNGYNDLTLHYSVLKPGEAFNLHTHEYSVDVISIVKGEGEVLTDGEENPPIKEGESVFARAGEAHGIKNTGDEEMITLGSQTPGDLELYGMKGYTFGKKEDK
ncbi:MAG TPA: cupin domain-containing protein [Halanaerobiales bacterium]|nr:cupin domain-containing protein [Halanaerobiales bacterium]